MTVIHVTQGPKRQKPKPGDRKVIKGVEHIRCFRMTNIGTQWAPYWAYDHTGGKQQYEWVPVDEADVVSCKRLRKNGV